MGKPTPKYVVDKNARFRNATTVLLNELINQHRTFTVEPKGDDAILADVLAYMSYNTLIKVDGVNYVPTEKGRDTLKNFYDKYAEYLRVFDIFCAVDLDKGEFAFSRFFDDMTQEQWTDFLAEKRFSDVRVAVAEFKKMDPLEIVFMSFINENRFETDKKGWQAALMGDKTWDYIAEICNTAVSCDYLTSEGVMENVVKQGCALMLDLLKKEEEKKKEFDAQQAEETTETVTETTEEVVEEDDYVSYVDEVPMPYYGYDYYYAYNDPYYISPCWEAVILADLVF